MMRAYLGALLVVLLPLITNSHRYYVPSYSSEEDSSSSVYYPLARSYTPSYYPSYDYGYSSLHRPSLIDDESPYEISPVYDDLPMSYVYVRREGRGKKKKKKKKKGGGGGWGKPKLKWVGWGWHKSQHVLLPGVHFESEKGPKINIHPKPVHHHHHGWGKKKEIKKGWGGVTIWGPNKKDEGGWGWVKPGKIIHAYEGWGWKKH